MAPDRLPTALYGNDYSLFCPDIHYRPSAYLQHCATNLVFLREKAGNRSSSITRRRQKEHDACVGKAHRAPIAVLYGNSFQNGHLGVLCTKFSFVIVLSSQYRQKPLIQKKQRAKGAGLKPTDVGAPDYFHKVVDCQWACPAHTPVPEYIRLIAAGRYSDAYMVNWESNVFPGILGRTCDRPCEPACRRGRVEEHNAEKPEPVAICRLKRVAADNKDDIRERLPRIPKQKNGKRIVCIGAGPASLTVARDLAPLGYSVTVLEQDPRAGGMIWSQIPRFRLPLEVIDEEVGYILGLDVEFRGGVRVDSLKKVLGEGYDAIFVGSGAPRGRDLDVPGRKESAAHIHIGIDWLSSVSFGHVDKIGKRVIVLGGGNTAMDCCRTSRRLGGVDVKVIVRSGLQEMKAAPWEKEDATHEDIPILNYLVPKAFTHESGRLTGVTFEKVKAVYDQKGRRDLVPTGEPDQHFECDDVLVAVGQENAFPWIER